MQNDKNLSDILKDLQRYHTREDATAHLRSQLDAKSEKEFESILQDEEKRKQILSSPEAQAILKKILGE